MFDFLRVTGLFFVTALAAFAWLLTLHPSAAGRTHAACGDVRVAVVRLWLWRVGVVVPARRDLVGGAICLAGIAIIGLQPRAASWTRGRS